MILNTNLFLNSRTLSRSHSSDPHSIMPVCLQEYFVHCVSTKWGERGRILWSFLHPIWLAISCHFCYFGFDWCIWSCKIYETRTLQIHTKRKRIYDWICKSWVPSCCLEHNCGNTWKSIDVTCWNSSKPSKRRRSVQIQKNFYLDGIEPCSSNDLCKKLFPHSTSIKINVTLVMKSN